MRSRIRNRLSMYCTIDLYEKAAQMPFQSTNGQEYPNGRKYDISAEKRTFSAYNPSLRIRVLACGYTTLHTLPSPLLCTLFIPPSKKQFCKCRWEVGGVRVLLSELQ
jgi:hypothetical protein